MGGKNKVYSSTTAAAATITVLLAAFFATSALAGCKKIPPIPTPPPSDQPAGVDTSNGRFPLSSIMLEPDGFQPEEGCLGASCNATDPCCPGCLCVPVFGKPNGFCFGFCCILPGPSI